MRCRSVCSGYDFGYLLKVLTDVNLPEEEEEFFSMIKLYFYNIYDVKYLMKSCKNLKGGLQEVAEQLEVRDHTYAYKLQGWLSLSICSRGSAKTQHFNLRY